MAFNLDDYNTVPERMAEAFAKYPDGRFQSDIVELPAAFADKFVAVKARYYRTPDDPTPGEGLAWELVPGKTPYTKDSELQNAETSAWGRALIAAFAADSKKGIASREEVQNRQPEPRPRSGPQQRTPRKGTTATETAPTPRPPAQASTVTEPSREAPDIELVRWVAKQKLALVDQLGGDKDKAKTIWRNVLASYSLEPDQLPDKRSLDFIESDLSVEVGKALEVAKIPGQEALLDPEVLDTERPFL